MSVRGEQQLFEAIDRLTVTILDQRERGWEQNLEVRLDSQRRYLDNEGEGDWPELSAGYAREKEAAVGNLPVLQYTTRMYRSLTEQGAPGFVMEEDADSLKVGTSDPKARWHHEGAGRLPVRRVMKKTDEEAQAHLTVLHDGYEAIAEGLGFRVN